MTSWHYYGTPPSSSTSTVQWVTATSSRQTRVNPDGLTVYKLARARGMRGRVVRGFFRLMWLWPP